MNLRVLLLLLLLLAGVLLLRSPRTRALGWATCGALLLLLCTLVQEMQSVPARVSPVYSSASPMLPAPAANLIEMQLLGSGAPWRLIGKLQNPSDVPVHAVTLAIERTACPASATPPEQCLVVWQGTREIAVLIPPRAARSVDESFYSHTPVPSPRGIVRDQIRVSSVH